MCTLAIYVRAFAGFPVVVAANRDEFLDRPTSGPRPLPGTTAIFAGRDEIAGGTWLGVNRQGVLAALLNRRTESGIDPSRRSRGQLCLSMLEHSTAASARQAAAREDPAGFNPFNLLVADRHGAWIAANRGDDRRIQLTDLEPGLHLVTNLDLNDPTCPKIAASHRLFAALTGDGAPAFGSEPFVEQLQTVLSGHDTQLDPRSPGFGNSLCLHSVAYGTRSSSIVWLDDSGRWTYRHTNDAPCRSRYQILPVTEALAAT